MHPPAPPASATGPATQSPCLDDLFDPETADYDTILQIVLVVLNRPDLYAQELRQPPSVWDVSSGRPHQLGAGSLALDVDMQEELCGAFREPSVSTKNVNSASKFKVPSDVYSALFKAPRVDEELSRAMGSSSRPSQSSDLKKALDALYETSMASWRLGWHLTVLNRFLQSRTYRIRSFVPLYLICTQLSKSFGRFRQLGLPLLSRLLGAWYWILQHAVAGRPYGLSSWGSPTVAPISLGVRFRPTLKVHPVPRSKLPRFVV